MSEEVKPFSAEEEALLEASWNLAEATSFELSPEAQSSIREWHRDCRRLLATLNNERAKHADSMGLVRSLSRDRKEKEQSALKLLSEHAIAEERAACRAIAIEVAGGENASEERVGPFRTGAREVATRIDARTAREARPRSSATLEGAGGAGGMTRTPETMTCDACGMKADGGRLTNGWWQYPAGWYGAESDGDSILVCSAECAKMIDGLRTASARSPGGDAASSTPGPGSVDSSG